ncbi:uncharacterized protein [Rutidosis leptorrhynchoides]|uniref:uncharacterized protein n=1 Tax=Rutidosis leptorrhynchoides TaxID=125765 RepID=UPI003A99BB3A
MDNRMVERILTIRHHVRATNLAAVQLICLLLNLITHHRFINLVNLPTRDELLHRRCVRDEILHSLSISDKCHDYIRMDVRAFGKLCKILELEGGLRPTQRMSVEEHVARFLHIVGNDLSNCFTSWIYRRSGSTVSRCFHRVLKAMLSLEGRYIKQPTGDVVPNEIQGKRRFYPFFKNCVGTIDGTHVRVKVNNKAAPRYRGRKGYPTINVLAACTFDLKFTYVLSGWEGRYCLVDAGLPHTSKLMAPYRGVRYHLKEYSSRSPENAKELFNLRHASLRNAIERAFGVLKKRFPIIRSSSEPEYSCETQSSIFLACCILHNFLIDEDRDKAIEEEVVQELLDADEQHHTRRGRGVGNASGEQLRNSIADEMWADYLLHPDDEIDFTK